MTFMAHASVLHYSQQPGKVWPSQGGHYVTHCRPPCHSQANRRPSPCFTTRPTVTPPPRTATSPPPRPHMPHKTDLGRRTNKPRYTRACSVALLHSPTIPLCVLRYFPSLAQHRTCDTTSNGLRPRAGVPTAERAVAMGGGTFAALSLDAHDVCLAYILDANKPAFLPCYTRCSPFAVCRHWFMRLNDAVVFSRRHHHLRGDAMVGPCHHSPSVSHLTLFSVAAGIGHGEHTGCNSAFLVACGATFYSRPAGCRGRSPPPGLLLPPHPLFPTLPLHQPPPPPPHPPTYTPFLWTFFGLAVIGRALIMPFARGVSNALDMPTKPSRDRT